MAWNNERASSVELSNKDSGYLAARRHGFLALRLNSCRRILPVRQQLRFETGESIQVSYQRTGTFQCVSELKACSGAAPSVALMRNAHARVASILMRIAVVPVGPRSLSLAHGDVGYQGTLPNEECCFFRLRVLRGRLAETRDSASCTSS